MRKDELTQIAVIDLKESIRSYLSTTLKRILTNKEMDYLLSTLLKDESIVNLIINSITIYLDK